MAVLYRTVAAAPLLMALAPAVLTGGCGDDLAAIAGDGGRAETAGPADVGMAVDLGADAAGPDRAADTSPDSAAVAVDAGADVSAAAPATGSYGKGPPLLESWSEAAIATVDGKLYVLGGYPPSRIPQRTLQIYDPASNRWRRGQDCPLALDHGMLAGVGGKLYSLGGQPSTDVTLVYDPAADRWQQRRRMPTARGGGAAAVIDDRIYVVGGRPPADNAFEMYDVVTDTWTRLPPLPARNPGRNHLGAGAIGGKIYVAGGRYGGGFVESPLTDSLDVFDPATGSWTARRPMLRPRGGVSAVVANGCLHVYGGEGANIGEPNGVFPDHDVYDPRSDTWRRLERLPVPFHGVTGGAFLRGLIYMPGGGTRSGGDHGSDMLQTYRPAMTCEG
jgi:N-acetylneuraminic acid mutarotase